MKRLLPAVFPSPLLSLVLFVLWLLLAQSLGAGTLLMGAILAWLIPVFSHGLRPTPVRVRKPLMVLRFARTVFIDMLKSNYAVARALLTRTPAQMASGFIHVPLELRDPNGLAVLAMAICATPGMAWGEIASDRSMLLVHALEMGDNADGLVAHIKTHYEKPLMEIFE